MNRPVKKTCRECRSSVMLSDKAFDKQWGLCSSCYKWYKKIGKGLSAIKVN